VGEADERLLLQVVGRRRGRQELPVGGRGGRGIVRPRQRVALVERGQTTVGRAGIVVAERGEGVRGLGPLAGLEIVVGGLGAGRGGGLLRAAGTAHGAGDG